MAIMDSLNSQLPSKKNMSLTEALRGINTTTGEESAAEEFKNNGGLSGPLGTLSPEERQQYLTYITPDRNTYRQAQYQDLLTNGPREYLGQEAAEVGLGESRFDEGFSNALQLEDIDAMRAAQQPNFNRIARSVGGMATLAATTAADSWVGIPAGIANMITSVATGEAKTFGQAVSAGIRNPVSEALQNINDAANEAFKVYVPAEQRDRPWYQNIFTTSFIGDTLLKNAGFAIGAAVGAKVAVGGLAKSAGLAEARDAFRGLAKEAGVSPSTLFKEIQAGKTAINGVKLTEELAKGARLLKNSELSLQLAGSLLAGMGEARMEAINGADEVEKDFEASFGNLETARSEALGAVLKEMEENGVDLTTEDGRDYYKRQAQLIDNRYKELREQIEHAKATVANTIFALNVPLLTAGDMLQFGKMMLGDYAVDREFTKGIRKAATKNALGMPVFELADSQKKAGLKTAARAAANVLTESNEEMAQSFFSSMAKAKSGSDIADFTARLYDPDAVDETISWLDAAKEGFRQSYGNSDDWVEGFAGGFMGFLGLPSISVRTQNDANADGKKKVDFKMNGGIWEPIRESRNTRRVQQETIDALNKTLSSEDFLKYYYGAVGGKSIDKEITNAVMEGNEDAYAKAQHKRFINDIITFDKAGALQDLRDIIEGMQNPDDAKVQQIKSVLGGTNTEDPEALKKRVSNNASKMKGWLDKYTEISRDLRTTYGGVMSDAQIEEMTWKTAHIDELEQFLKDKADALSPMLYGYKAKLAEKGDTEEKSDYELLASSGFRTYLKNADSEEYNKLETAKKDAERFKTAYDERDRYIDFLTRLTDDPNLIETKQKAFKKRNEDLQKMLRSAVYEGEMAQAASLSDYTKYMEADGTVADDILEAAKAQKAKGNPVAKEFLDLYAAGPRVNETIDRLGKEAGLSAEDISAAKASWNYMRLNAPSLAVALSGIKEEQLGVAGVSDDALKLANDAIAEVAKEEAYADYIAKADDAGSNEVIEQDRKGDPNRKLPNGRNRAKISLVASDGVIDKEGNSVTGTYYFLPGNNKVYDKEGNLLPDEFIIKRGAVEIPFSEAPNVFSSLIGTRLIYYKDDVVDPWRENITNPGGPTPPPPGKKPKAGEAPAPAETPKSTTRGTSIKAYSVTKAAASLKKGDAIQFGMREKDGPIYLLHNNEVVGELAQLPEDQKQMVGGVELVEALRKEYSEDKKNANGFFVSSRSTKVRGINTKGSVDYAASGKESSLVDLPGAPAVRDMQFIYVDGKGKIIPLGATMKANWENPKSFNGRPGTFYLLIPKADGGYGYPVALRQVALGKEQWERIKDTSFGKKLLDACKRAMDYYQSQGNTSFDFKAFKKTLEQYLYLETKQGDKIKDVHIEPHNRNGVKTVTVEVGGKQIGKEASNAEELLDALLEAQCKVNIYQDTIVKKWDKYSDFFYDGIISTGLLTANLQSFSADAQGFFMDYFLPDGQGGGTFVENIEQPNRTPIKKRQRNAASSESSEAPLELDHTIVTYGGDRYAVDTFGLLTGEAGFVPLATGERLTYEQFAAKYPGLTNKLFCAAYVIENPNAEIADGKYIIKLPSGKEIGYNSTTQTVFTGSPLTALRAAAKKKFTPAVQESVPAEAPMEVPAEPAPVQEPVAPAPAPEAPSADSTLQGMEDFEFQIMPSANSTTELSEQDKEFIAAHTRRIPMSPKAKNATFAALKALRGKKMSALGNKEKVKKTLSATLPSEVVDFLIEGVNKYPELRDLDIFTLYNTLMRTQMYDIAKTYNEAVTKPADAELDRFLANYLKQYHIDVKYSDLKERFGSDVRGLFDVIRKTIHLANDGSINEITMPEEFAHAFIELMGGVMSKRDENADFTFLMENVDGTEIFKQVYNTYKDVYTKDGEPDLYKIRKEAVGQALAAALVHNWEQQNNPQEKTFWDKLRALFERVLEFFKGASYISFEDEIDKISKEILLGDTSRLHKVNDTGYSVLDYVETVTAQIKRDGGKAVDFMKYFNSIGNYITGSLAYRREGTVYRGSLDALHDIDMSVPPSAHNIDLDYIFENFLHKDSVVLFDHLMTQPYFKKIKADYPKIKFGSAFGDSFGRKKLTVNAVYSENEELSERFLAMSGSYATRLDKFTEEERGQIYLFDFFIESEEYPNTYDGIFGLRFTDSDIPRREKQFYMGRAKDIFDYQMWQDFEQFARDEISANEDLMLQKDAIALQQTVEAIDTAEKALSEITTDDNTSLNVNKAPVQLSSGEQKLLEQKGWTQADWDRLSEREKERAKECVIV